MSGLFDRSFAKLHGIEGDFSNDPADSGGATRYGITEVQARKSGYHGPMEDLPLETARAIYRAEYWDGLSLDAIGALSETIAYELFDTAVNLGQGNAALFLQRSLNALNRNGRDYLDLRPDGKIGPMTVEALRAFLNRRAPHGEKVMSRALNSLQGAFYITLAERREKDERFLFGWLLNRVEIA